jgi:hypothetical protein
MAYIVRLVIGVFLLSHISLWGLLNPSVRITTNSANHIILIAQAASSVSKIHYYLRESALNGYYGQTASRIAFINRTTTAMTDLDKSFKLLQLGSKATTNTYAGVDGLDDLFYENACQYVDSSLAHLFNLPQTCETYSNGVLKSGLVAVIQKYQARARFLAQQLSSPSNMTSLVTAIQDEEILGGYINLILESLPNRIITSVVEKTERSSMRINTARIVILIAISIWFQFIVVIPLARMFERRTFDLHFVLVLLAHMMKPMYDPKALNNKPA